MPTYIFSCDNNHVVEKYKSTPYKRNPRKRCKQCGLYMRRDYRREYQRTPQKTLHLDYNKDPISFLTRKRSFRGVMIENLSPEPTFVRTEAQYNRLLKDAHAKEKPR